MRLISEFTPEQIIDYNLRDGGTAVTIFADAQAARVERARAFVTSVLSHLDGQPTIIELGCSAGDIGGWFTDRATVTGVDVVPAAVALCRERYPEMTIIEAKAEDVEPQACDVLILTEFLEHIHDAVGLVQRWLPLAQFAVIGHPINDPGGIEPGHIWSYDHQDYFNWLQMGGHYPLETHLFAGPFPEMVMGVSRRTP